MCSAANVTTQFTELNRFGLTVAQTVQDLTAPKII